jgi:hypothetical protein
MVVKAKDRAGQTRVAIKIFHEPVTEDSPNHTGGREEAVLALLQSVSKPKAE